MTKCSNCQADNNSVVGGEMIGCSWKYRRRPLQLQWQGVFSDYNIIDYFEPDVEDTVEDQAEDTQWAERGGSQKYRDFSVLSWPPVYYIFRTFFPMIVDSKIDIPVTIVVIQNAKNTFVFWLKIKLATRCRAINRQLS